MADFVLRQGSKTVRYFKKVINAPIKINIKDDVFTDKAGLVDMKAII